MNNVYDVIILGAGASGLFLGAHLQNKKIAIIDSNRDLGLKILASGGGKCNLTNEFVTEENYLGDRKFIKKSLENFSSKDLLNYFQTRGVVFQTRENNQFFCKNSAKDITNILRKENSNSRFFFNQKILQVEKEREVFTVTTERKTFKGKSVVVATGGESYKEIGASRIGYEIAESFDIGVEKTSPGLVGFTVQPDEFWFKNLSGVSFQAKVTVGEKSFVRDILFTHKGISGPLVLNASVFRKKGSIEIDFLPTFSFNEIKKSNKFISTAIPLPKRFLKEFLNKFNLEDKAYKNYNKIEVELIHKLKNYVFAPAGDFGYSKAEVTKGGVNTSFISSSNLMSKKIENLFFIGEVLDVTGELGGFNFQWAFSSAFTASIFLKENID